MAYTRGALWWLLIATALSYSRAECDPHNSADLGKATIAYSWNIVEYEWPDNATKQQAIDDSSYIPVNNAVNGIKLYGHRVFVTVPRLKPGVPSTLNEIVENTDTSMTSVSHVLRPYPSWDMQALGNCSALQRVQSMEIDPATGHMWIVDTGYTPKMSDITVQPVDACRPKIIVYDIKNNREISRYHFPETVIAQGLFYLNDIVLEVHNGAARYAYMSDTLDYKLVVYDFKENTSYSYAHENMKNDPTYENITISNLTLPKIITGINGIAMSPDFKYLYYSSVAGIGLHQIETSVLRTARGDDQAFANAVRTIGNKVSPGDGMAYGAKHNLYYSALEHNAVYKWNIKQDLPDDSDYNKVQLQSQSAMVQDARMDWIDTLALDDCGYLWFTTSRLNKFFSSGGVVHHEPNFVVWKVYVDDYNYLDPRYHDNQTTDGSFIRASVITVMVVMLLSYIL